MCAFVFDKLIIKAAEDARSYSFQTSYEEADDGLKNSLFHSAEVVLTKMAHCGTLDDVFEHIIEKWIKFNTFIDTLTSRALVLFRFVRLVAKIVPAKIKKQSSRVDSVGGKPKLSFHSRQLFYPC